MVDDRPVLRIGHSPDPDDAFMWWPLSGAETGFDTGRFRYEPVTDDIESLNHRAETGELEITALSCVQAARVADRYAVTSCGASIGQGCGPKIVACESLTPDDLRKPGAVLAVPGTRTTAFAVASILLGPGSFAHVEVPFDRIIGEVTAGRCTAGLIIHEGQLTFARAGLHLVADLGMWWSSHCGLPLPLGVNAVRRDLVLHHGDTAPADVNEDLTRCLRFAMEHREQALAYAQQFARDLEPPLVEQFVDMYVNRWTVDLGTVGRAAVRTLLRESHRAGLGPDPEGLEFIE
ncbi:MAG: ABC transporter substrate-binding protein [Planctomycetes bacterium]|nr:ABC transporter substrate-binding protein [Planctomycetota bacterium]